MRLASVLDRLKWTRRPHAPAWHGSGSRWRKWQRAVWRSMGALPEMKVPRGLGASGAALLLLGSVTYGAIRGGHSAEIAANLQDLCDGVANAAGFRISEVALTGEHQLGRDRVLAAAGVTAHSSLLFLDPAKTRSRLLTNPWIAEATVLKLYPGRLRIEVKERKPFALWQKDGNLYLIADDGTVLETYVPQRFASLPLVVGKGAEHSAASLLALLRKYPDIANQLQASVLVAERRWDLYLKNKVVLMLPEEAPEQALRRVVALDQERRLFSRDIVAVDLRLPDRVAVRQGDRAAAARDAALKAAEKQKKKKGGEA